MITGQVNSKVEAIVNLRVRGPTGTLMTVDAVIDTGFASALSLPAAAIAVLGLPYDSVDSATLADGSICHFGVYEAEIPGGGNWQPVAVYALGDEVLLGMGLLLGQQLTIAVVPGGAVEIVPLP